MKNKLNKSNTDLNCKFKENLHIEESKRYTECVSTQRDSSKNISMTEIWQRELTKNFGNKDLESQLQKSPIVSDIIYDNHVLVVELERIEQENEKLKYLLEKEKSEKYYTPNLGQQSFNYQPTSASLNHKISEKMKVKSKDCEKENFNDNSQNYSNETNLKEFYHKSNINQHHPSIKGLHHNMPNSIVNCKTYEDINRIPAHKIRQMSHQQASTMNRYKDFLIKSQINTDETL